VKDVFPLGEILSNTKTDAEEKNRRRPAARRAVSGSRRASAAARSPGRLEGWEAFGILIVLGPVLGPRTTAMHRAACKINHLRSPCHRFARSMMARESALRR
jgi:hypothetical protein